MVARTSNTGRATPKEEHFNWVRFLKSPTFLIYIFTRGDSGDRITDLKPERKIPERPKIHVGYRELLVMPVSDNPNLTVQKKFIVSDNEMD